jgi:hypothetical protein
MWYFVPKITQKSIMNNIFETLKQIAIEINIFKGMCMI